MTDLDSLQNESSPERFAPEDVSDGLIEAEHRARYWWAAQWVADKHVLDAGCGTGYGLEMLLAYGPESVKGVDLSEEAVADAGRRLGDQAELVRADVRDLPLEDGSFDVVVCFEVIEHVERQRDALDELKRVLRPGGVLLISSPNRDVYPPGNPHHVREYLPEELRAELEERYQNVTLYRQHPWLASGLLPDEHLVAEQPREVLAGAVGERIDPGSETYTVAVASDAPLSAAPGIVVDRRRLRGPLVARATRPGWPCRPPKRAGGGRARRGGPATQPDRAGHGADGRRAPWRWSAGSTSWRPSARACRNTAPIASE